MLFFFFKQKTAYEMRISDWSSDVCSSDLVDAARPAGDRGADGARHGDADVLRVQHTVGGLTERLGDGELVQLLVVALLQVDDLALRGAADEDHRIAVGRGMGQRGQAVEEARRRHREADTRPLRQESGKIGRAHVELQSLMRIPYAV